MEGVITHLFRSLRDLDLGLRDGLSWIQLIRSDRTLRNVNFPASPLFSAGDLFCDLLCL